LSTLLDAHLPSIFNVMTVGLWCHTFGTAEIYCNCMRHRSADCEQYL